MSIVEEMAITFVQIYCDMDFECIPWSKSFPLVSHLGIFG